MTAELSIHLRLRCTPLENDILVIGITCEWFENDKWICPSTTLENHNYKMILWIRKQKNLGKYFRDFLKTKTSFVNKINALRIVVLYELSSNRTSFFLSFLGLLLRNLVPLKQPLFPAQLILKHEKYHDV